MFWLLQIIGQPVFAEQDRISANVAELHWNHLCLPAGYKSCIKLKRQIERNRWFAFFLNWLVLILVHQHWNKKKCLISDEDIRSPATTMSDSSMNTSLANLPEWMVVGENIRLKQTNCRCINCPWLNKVLQTIPTFFTKVFLYFQRKNSIYWTYRICHGYLDWNRIGLSYW